MTDDPHVPRPREHELDDGRFVVSSHWVHGVKDTTEVAPGDRQLYRLLLDVLEDAHVPDLLPARLATAAEDLVDAKAIVEDINRGRVDIAGAGYGMSYCYRVRDAIEAYRDREPVRLVAVGCSGSKYDVDEPVPAQDLYKGTYWGKKHDYGRTIGDDWRIISAQYALLHPETEIGHYERTPGDLRGVPVDASGRLPNGDAVATLLDQWALDVYEGLASWLREHSTGVDPRNVELQILLGRKYDRPLRDRGVFDALRTRGDLSLSFPFREIDFEGNGQQMAWMGDQVDATRGEA